MRSSCIETTFNQLFEKTYRTRLVGGADEPFYQADKTLSYIHYCHDYESSALHEVAHWCIAGAKRRRRDDYGYWYEGVRDELKQSQFEAVEVRPQALEWIFSRAAGVPFRVSVDNLLLPDYDAQRFRKNVQQSVVNLLYAGLTGRAQIFANTLSQKAKTKSYDRLEFYAELPS